MVNLAVRDIDTHDFVTILRETRGADGPDITHSKDADTHVTLLRRQNQSMSLPPIESRLPRSRADESAGSPDKWQPQCQFGFSFTYQALAVLHRRSADRDQRQMWLFCRQ